MTCLLDCGNRAGRCLSLLLIVLVACAGRRALGADSAATGPVAVDHSIVAAFERFQPDGKLDVELGGRLLLGELNCASCHQPTEAVAATLGRKQAPILDNVGSRVRPSWVRQFLADPQHAKPGTTMPNLLSGLSEAEKTAKIESLVHFLASTGSLLQRNPDRKQIPAGERLFHQIGCVACHGPRQANAQALAAMSLATTVPLGDLAAKYTVPGLASFLADPHKVRPSGRMPAFNLSQEESLQLASYLLADVRVDPATQNLSYGYYEGHWDRVPDFAKIEPNSTGASVGFDCTLAARSADTALRFSGYLRIDAPGDYTFYTTSDDGSRLWIDGRLAVDNDGVHGSVTKSGPQLTLDKGLHELVAGVFNAGGGMVLEIEFEGAGRGRQSVLPQLSLTREAAKKPASPDNKEDVLLLDSDLVAKGRETFLSLGCAACHAMSSAKPPADRPHNPLPLDELKTDRGCLAKSSAAGVPVFALSTAQRGALAAAIKSLGKSAAGALAPRQVIQQTLLALNCYACHARGGLGGVEEASDPYFETNQKEMGDEGRLPPPLDGVGAKLTANWLRHIFADGTKDRPYMLTRMPRFGQANAGPLIEALAAVDTLEPVAPVAFSVADRDVKAAGRLIVGDKGGLGCVKCHNFRDIPSTGIQAMNLTLMPQRLRHDWFQRYVLNPQEFRPGTRMPAAWPGGQTFLRKTLDGTAATQIEAVWRYLSDDGKALIPLGLSRGPIELVPVDGAIIYRNFIEGAGPRAIGVGYPERANLAFDANDLRLALLWQGPFFDASGHWTDRGGGFQPPLGDNLLTLAAGPSFATLDSPTAAWPKQSAKTLGYQFRGYRLTKDDRPTFLYDLGGIHVADFPNAVTGEKNPALRRTLTFKSEGAVVNLWYRAAVAASITALPDGWYDVGGAWKTRVGGEPKEMVEPILRETVGQAELLVPIKLVGGQYKLVQDYVW